MAKDQNPPADVATGTDTANAPANVETLERTRVRTTTSQTADLPPVGKPSVDTPAVLPRYTDADPAGQVAGRVDAKTAKKSQVQAFLDITGYQESDIIGSNAERRTFVTSNGGKYELSPKGKKVRVLSGPTPPGREEEEDDQD